MMRRVSEIGGSLTLGGIVLCALWVVLRDGAMLASVGGWYAVFGQFLAVAATVSLLLFLGALILALLALPALFVLRLVAVDPGAGSPRALGRVALDLADPVWKAAWWSGWYLARVFRGERP